MSDGQRGQLAGQVAVDELGDHLAAHVGGGADVHLLGGTVQDDQQRGAVLQVGEVPHLVAELLLDTYTGTYTHR